MTKGNFLYSFSVCMLTLAGAEKPIVNDCTRTVPNKEYTNEKPIHERCHVHHQELYLQEKTCTFCKDNPKPQEIWRARHIKTLIEDQLK